MLYIINLHKKVTLQNSVDRFQVNAEKEGSSRDKTGFLFNDQGSNGMGAGMYSNQSMSAGTADFLPLPVQYNPT